LFQSRRLVPSWSFKTVIGNGFKRLFLAYASHVRMMPFYASALQLKECYVLVNPGPAELYPGVIRHTTVKPTSMPAVWLPAPLSDPEYARVLIHFQGGTFVLALDPVPTGTPAAKVFAKVLNAITCYAQDRLARDDRSRFPAAVQDAVSFYQYVLDQGVRPANIIISGDSAGGSVAIGLMRYIESTKFLPSPSGVMLSSPWADVSAGAITNYSKSKSLKVDFLGLELIWWGKAAYEPKSKDYSEETDCYLRPVEHPLRSSVPIFVNSGSAELFHDEITLFVERMNGVAGNRVQYVGTKDAMHDLILCGLSFGFEKEAQDAVKLAASFFDRGN
ncbi:Alpha/Beta hydrolase protein, partial [Clohesyomyces aquaticus]